MPLNKLAFRYLRNIFVVLGGRMGVLLLLLLLLLLLPPCSCVLYGR